MSETPIELVGEEIKDAAQQVVEKPQTAMISSWLPDSIKDKIGKYDTSDQARVAKNIADSFDQTLNQIADEFEQPVWLRNRNEKSFVKLPSDKERIHFLNILKISKEDISSFISLRHDYRRDRTNPEVENRYNEIKKKLASQIWEKTSGAWERNRTDREKRLQYWDRAVANGKIRQMRFFNRVAEGRQNLIHEFKGIAQAEKFLDRIYALAAGVEQHFLSADAANEIK